MEGRLDAMENRLEKMEAVLERIDGRLAKIESNENKREGGWRVILFVTSTASAVVAWVVTTFFK